MKIVVIGLGSMGKRRIRILTEYFKDMEIIGVDDNPLRRKQCYEQYSIDVHDSLDLVLANGKIEGAFVCTSPLSHADIIEKCLARSVHVFTELNLTSDKYEKNVALAKQNECILFLSSTPLYRKEMNYVIDRVQNTQAEVNYMYHVGQYLPDWHPWESFKDYFIGKKATNGCRELFAIELPWLIKAFGDVEEVRVMSRKISKLDIDYDDSYLVLLQHKNGNQGCLAIDVVCREPVRKLEIYGEELFVQWQGTVNSLKEKNLRSNLLEKIMLYNIVDQRAEYSENIIENPYMEEIKAFFSEIAGKSASKHSFSENLAVLALIDQIEAHKL